MPCDSIITQSVDLSKCGDPALLSEAMQSVDLKGCYMSNGKLVGNRDYVGKVADQIKQAYSKKSVYAAAKKQGWMVKEVGPNKLQVIRRY